MSTSSAASTWRSLPTYSVPRPRWLCVARGTSSRMRSTSPSANPASSSRAAALSRTMPCAHAADEVRCDVPREVLDEERLPDHDLLDRLREQLGEPRHVDALLRGAE